MGWMFHNWPLYQGPQSVPAASTPPAAPTSGSTGATWAAIPSGIVREYLLGLGDGVTISFRFYTDGADQPWVVYKAVPAVEAIGEFEGG